MSSQKDVADALGVSASLLSSWENDLAVPTMERLVAYATFFDPDRTLGVLDELKALRLVGLRGDAGATPLGLNDLVAVLADIRFVLSEIRDRMPPLGG